MIWSENKVHGTLLDITVNYSRYRFKKLNRLEFQFRDLFISNEFRAELFLKQYRYMRTSYDYNPEIALFQDDM